MTTLIQPPSTRVIARCAPYFNAVQSNALSFFLFYFFLLDTAKERDFAKVQRINAWQNRATSRGMRYFYYDIQCIQKFDNEQNSHYKIMWFRRLRARSQSGRILHQFGHVTRIKGLLTFAGRTRIYTHVYIRRTLRCIAKHISKRATNLHRSPSIVEKFSHN